MVVEAQACVAGAKAELVLELLQTLEAQHTLHNVHAARASTHIAVHALVVSARPIAMAYTRKATEPLYLLSKPIGRKGPCRNGARGANMSK